MGEDLITPKLLAELLESSLGRDSAERLVDQACRELGYRGGVLDRRKAHTVLEHLGKLPGLVAVVARLAKGRLESRLGAATSSVFEDPSKLKTAPVSVSRKTVPRSTMTTLLANSLGDEKSQSIIIDAAKKLGLNPNTFTQAQAESIFDSLIESSGLIGVVARFAKGHLVRTFAKTTNAPVSDGHFVPRDEVIDMLSEGIPRATAIDSVNRAAKRLGFDSKQLNRSAANALLEDLSAAGGDIGANARLVKTRLAARFLRARMRSG